MTFRKHDLVCLAEIRLGEWVEVTQNRDNPMTFYYCHDAVVLFFISLLNYSVLFFAILKLTVVNV